MNRRITVLQTAALPLGYAAVSGSGHILTRDVSVFGAGNALTRDASCVGAGNGI